MNTTHYCSRLSIPALVLLLSTLNPQLSTVLAQGPLAPPGAPAPTMKTLNEIDAKLEKRIPISSLPYTISTGGSHYLTTNLGAVGSGGGITIGANGVTLDLNGFALIGGGAGSSSGVDVPLAQKGLHVRNGTIRNWAASGIAASNATDSSFEDLRILDNQLVVADSFAAALHAGPGCVLRNCVASNNRNATFTGYGSGLEVSTGSLVVHCVADNNGGIGIFTGNDTGVFHCTTKSNAVGIYSAGGCSVEDCVANANVSYGISVTAGSTVRNCTVRGNSIGVYAGVGGCQIAGNTCDLNHNGMQVEGIGTRIDGNSATANGQYGIYVPGPSNIVIRNVARGNATLPYNLHASTVFGRIVDMTAGGQIPDTIGQPWSNFSY